MDCQNYEQAMAELEKLTRQMETGELGIDQMASQLRKAQELSAFCRKQLYKVEEEVKKCLSPDLS